MGQESLVNEQIDAGEEFLHDFNDPFRLAPHSGLILSIQRIAKYFNLFHPAQLERENPQPVGHLRGLYRNDPVAVLSGTAQAVRYVGKGNTGGLAPFR